MFREHEKGKSLHEFSFYIYHKLMQGIKDDRFCATLTIYLTVGCFKQLNTSMEITGKHLFQTTQFNL